tara:strand:+ start:2162 stop:2467 length:306 start_codon:yes stop_codon:yes gene_type:complete
MSIIAFITVLLVSIATGICLAKGLLYILRSIDPHAITNDSDDDDDVSGREESQRIKKNQTGTCESYSKIYDNTYTYYLGTNKNKTYKKRIRPRWQEEFDFN